MVFKIKMSKGISNLQIENALESMNNEDIYDNFVPKQDIFFFDSFGLDSLKHFIIQDNRSYRTIEMLLKKSFLRQKK